jgi:hypothetical protein
MILASVTDETGEPCAIKPSGNTSGYVASGQSQFINELTAPAQAVGFGQTVLRDLILSNRYRQEAFPDGNFTDSLRMREIEVPDAIRNFNLTSTDLWKSVNLLHSVPRLNNPSGTFDNDQYLLTIWVPDTTAYTTLTTAITAALVSAGNGVVIDPY